MAQLGPGCGWRVSGAVSLWHCAPATWPVLWQEDSLIYQEQTSLFSDSGCLSSVSFVTVVFRSSFSGAWCCAGLG